MNDDNSLDLLDLDDNGAMDTLPDATPFAAPRPKKPWLLLSVGLVVIVLATYVIIRAIGDESSSSIEVDLDAPVVVDAGQGADMNVMPPVQPVQAQPQPVQVQPQPVAQPQPKPQPVVQPQPVAATAGVPVRVVEERKEVKFNPTAESKPVAQPKPAAKPAAKPVAKAAAKPAAKPVAKTVAKPVAGAWYVQFGSYSTRALAESAQRQIQNAHKSLFDGQQFVILAAQLKDGKTTYRLRVAFKTAADANGFCRNAKSDGLDCYVAK
ncbi:MAG: SPOR domain-containing protein [Alphaproteobacteria bacterium]|nr:SPOR domain-containing protein [Alphaproteobacteria bacterium]